MIRVRAHVVRRVVLPGTLALPCALAACAAPVDPAPAFAQAGDEIRAVTGAREVYHPDAAEDVDARVAELLRNGLDPREAVEVGLLANPGLQAAFRDVGMAAADRVQAGLLTNPFFSAELRFPSGGGGADIDLGLFGSLADLWQIPAREDVAQAALERRILEVAREAAALVADIRAAYVETLATERLLVVAEESRGLASTLVDVAEERVAARAATEIDAQLARLAQLDADVTAQDAALAADEARRRLLELLGFPSEPPLFALAGALPDDAPDLPDLTDLQTLALLRRPDVRAAKAWFDEAVAEVRREEGLVLRVLDLGLVAEREGGWSVGPGVAFELPLFDQNQAQVARALQFLAQRERLMTAVRLAAVHDVASARARVAAGADAVRLVADGILPQTEATLELARESYRAGRTALLPVLEAQREVLAARRAHVLRLQQAADALVDLEFATAATREELQEAARRAAAEAAERDAETAPATATATEAEAEAEEEAAAERAADRDTAHERRSP